MDDDKNKFLIKGLDLNKKFTRVVGEYYSPFTVKGLLEEVDILIASKDLQFIEHSVNEILFENTIEIKINIFEGKYGHHIKDIIGIKSNMKMLEFR